MLKVEIPYKEPEQSIPGRPETLMLSLTNGNVVVDPGGKVTSH